MQRLQKKQDSGTVSITMTKTMLPNLYVLISAAGTGSRSQLALPKQYHKIKGISVLRHTINRFCTVIDPAQIQVIISAGHEDFYQEATAGLTLPAPVYGGKTRKTSIYNALKQIPDRAQDSIILIHDAARPFVTEDLILKIHEAALRDGAATAACPVKDTLVRRNDRLFGDIVDRDHVYAVQTPQAFRYSVLLEAHEKLKDDHSFTDDAGLVKASGHPVHLVEGDIDNIKLTYREDFDYADKRLNMTQYEYKTGQGFDVHAFGDAASHIRLGGIDIPFDRKLSGHSDADVALHAITDAVLGALAEGDIGQIFPPSDPQWQGADSGLFLKHASELAGAKQAQITHIDLTLICEAPKIGPYAASMRERIASILTLDMERVSVKATTTEKLGFTGRKEGIAAMALATVRVPCG